MARRPSGELPKFVDTYVTVTDRGIQITEAGQEWLDWAVATVKNVKWAADKKLRIPTPAGTFEIGIPGAQWAENFIDDMAYKVASMTGPSAPPFASVDVIRKSLIGGNYEIPLTKGQRPGVDPSEMQFDLLHAYIYEDGFHRKKMRSSFYKPTSWTRDHGDWKSLIDTPGVKHGVYLSTPGSYHTSQIAELNPGEFYQTWNSLYEPVETLLGFTEVSPEDHDFMNTFFGDAFSENGVYKRFNHEDASERGFYYDDVTLSQLQSAHEQVYEMLYNVSQSGLPQQISGLADFRYEANPFAQLGLANFKIDANLAHFTASLGYDPERDQYYFSTTDIWDFGKDHSKIWGPGRRYTDTRDNDKYLVGHFGGKDFIFDMSSNFQSAVELDKIEEIFGKGVRNEASKWLDSSRYDWENREQDQWQADLMDATGEPIYLYDRMYIPDDISNKWFDFYGIEPADKETKIKWQKQQKKLDMYKNHKKWGTISADEKRAWIQKLSWYENDPKLQKSEFSHVNLEGIAPEIFGKNWVKLEGEGYWENRRDKYVYNKVENTLFNLDDYGYGKDGDIQREENFATLYELHNSVNK